MTPQVTKEGVRYLTPHAGKMLKNGDNYSDLVFLARDADPNDWTEIDASEVPDPAELEPEEPVDDQDYVEAAKILLGEE